jgi:hypothetical protein
VPADAYTQERPREIVQLVGESSRKERVPSRAGAIALKTEIVDDLVGIERQVQLPAFHCDIV